MPTVQDYSVKFGRDPVMGLEGVNAFPYFYSLINQNDDVDWTPGTTPPDLTPVAILCKANSMTPKYVRLDPDYNYKLIAIKYGAYYNNRGVYQWYENFNTASLYIPDVLPGSRFTGNIQVSLSIQGSGSATLFGGQSIEINSNAAKIPLAVECMQGYESGFQAMRCEYLLPMQGILAFEFTNTHPNKDLYVTAMMYGMKIRL